MGSSPKPIPNDQMMIRYQQEAATPLSKANALVVVSQDDYVMAGNLKKATRELRQRITGWFRGTKEEPGPLTLAHAVWQGLIDREKKLLEPLATADAVLERKMLAYQKADRERREAEQRAAEAEALRRAEDERLAAAVIIAEEAEVTGDQKLMAAAEEMIEMPLDVAPVYVASNVPKVAGVVTKKEFHVEVTDIRSLLLAIAAGEMMGIIEKADTPCSLEDRRVVAEFLKQFQPVRGNTLEPIRRDKKNLIEGAGVFDANMPWLRNASKAAMKFAGVLAEWRDAIV